MLWKRVFAILLMLVAAAWLCACRDAGQKVVLSVGGYPVTVEEYTYFYCNYRDRLVSDDVTDEIIRDNVLSALRQKYAAQKLADDRGITLIDEEKKQADSQYDAYAESVGGKDALSERLTENHFTERYFRQTLEDVLLQDKLYDVMTSDYEGDIQADDATVIADVHENFYRIKQIMILHDEGDSLADNYRLAEKLLERIRAGEDFDTMVVKYNEDTAMDTANGYYFTSGQILSEVENAAKELAIGEISDVIRSDVGYHIVCRLPLEDEYISSHLEDLRRAYRARVYHERIQATADSFEIKYYDRYAEMTF